MRLQANINCICHRFGECRCNDVFKAEKLWLDNINDTCQTIGEVMVAFGLLKSQFRKAKPIIREAFIYYDEVRQRVDMPPKKSHA